MDRLVEIGRFDNPVEAHMLLDVLTDAGIDARIFDEHTGSALPHIGAIGVRVVVRAEDAARAAAAIEAERALPRGPHADAPDEMPWRLAEGEGAAGEEDGEGGEDEDEDDEEEEADEDASGDVEASQAAHGKGGPLVGAGPDREAAAVAWATRTRTFALVGLACFLFSFGALFRAMDAPPDVEEFPVARRRLRQARILAWGMVCAAGLAAVGLWLFLYTRAR